MDIEDGPPSVNFIPCVKWVKKGVAKEIPEKVQLSKEELQDIINQTRTDLRIVKEEEDEEATDGSDADADAETEAEAQSTDTKHKGKSDSEDEFNFDDYDKEDNILTSSLSGIGNLTMYASNTGDPYVTINDDDCDSDKEDDVVQPNDNLILVGHVEGNISVLEVYVYNEEQEALYVLHDILLPAVPLCMEWLNYDPGEGKSGNLCLVGSMSPIIQAWDIDVIDCLEPAFKLGNRGSKKKGIAKYGHEDAVLDLSWNKNLPHVLASGSVDQTVLLWDLDEGKYATKLSFEEKVQSIQWHPYEGQTLLTGSCDRFAKVFDCRVDDTHKDWKVNGEVEKVLWDHFNPFSFFVGTDSGSVQYIDCRNKKPVWELEAHSNEITGIALSSQCPGMLFTAGGDGCLKTWDILNGAPNLVYTKEAKLGTILCLDSCPDLPYVVSMGGDKRSDNFAVFDTMNSTAVQNKFGNRNLIRPIKKEEKDPEDVSMVPSVEPKTEDDSEMDTIDTMFQSMVNATLSAPSTSGPSTSKSKVKNFQSKGKKKEKKKLKKKK